MTDNGKLLWLCNNSDCDVKVRRKKAQDSMTLEQAIFFLKKELNKARKLRKQLRENGFEPVV